MVGGVGVVAVGFDLVVAVESSVDLLLCRPSVMLYVLLLEDW